MFPRRKSSHFSVKFDSFQSPFSGDFLCFFTGLFHVSCDLRWAFNLHFQETFFVSKELRAPVTLMGEELFQSPFSGDFLCFEDDEVLVAMLAARTFNLHFQETFFVSMQYWVRGWK